MADQKSTSDRVERLLALMLINTLKTTADKAYQLNLAGFTNIEVADLLETSTGTIAQSLYDRKKKSSKKKQK
jgi:hypothetical protein